MKIYGLKNCDSCKKALRWCDEQKIDYQFYDFKKQPLTAETLTHFLAHCDMSVLLNKRGTTWRKLSDADKENEDMAHVQNLMLANNSLLKRPIWDFGDDVMVGFTDAVKARIG